MTVRKLLFAVSLLFFATGPYADAADVLDFVETERQASTDIADTLWQLGRIRISRAKQQQYATKLLG